VIWLEQRFGATLRMRVVSEIIWLQQLLSVCPQRGRNALELFVFEPSWRFPVQCYLYVSAELANTSGIVTVDCPPVTSTEPSFSRVAV